MLIERIKQMHEHLHRNGMARKVNHGGCGAMAITLANTLKSQYGIDSDIVFVGYDDQTCNIRRSRFGDLYEFIECSEWSHIMVRFKHKGRTYYLDCVGLYSPQAVRQKYHVVYTGKVTVQEMIHLSKNIIFWNTTWEQNFRTKSCRNIIRAYLKNN